LRTRARRLRPSIERMEPRLVLSHLVVSPLGDDTASGSASAPWKTLQHAANSALPGDVVEVMAGNYSGFSLTSRGSAVAPITFRADPGAAITSPGPDGLDGITLQSNNVEITGFQIAGMPRDGILATGGNSISLLQNSITSSAAWGIDATGVTGLDIEGNATSSSNTGGGILVDGSGPGMVARENVAQGNAGSGISLIGEPTLTGALIERNVLQNDGTGIDLAGVQGSQIRDNLATGLGTAGIVLHPSASGGVSTGDQVVNNTVTMAGQGWALALLGGSSRAVVLDNILLDGPGGGSVAASADSLPGLVSNANIGSDVYSTNGGSSNVSLWSWQAATGLDSQSFTSTAASLFASTASGNYHPAATGPAIGTGLAPSTPSSDLDGRVRPLGSVDIGAYQSPPGTTSPTTNSAGFIGLDTTTSGSWTGSLGKDGYALLGVTDALPGYASVVPSGQSSTVWSSSTTDPRALLSSPTSTTRVASAWSSTTSFQVDLRLADGATHQLSLYAVDWDNQGRSERVDLIDPNTGAVLASQTIGSFGNGQYLDFTASGHVLIRVTNLSGPSAVLSGIFLDPPAAGPAGFDLTTQGNWASKYGGSGYVIFGGNASLPSSISVTPSGNSTYVWAGSTSDPRALSQSPSSTQGIAGTWYTSGQMTIDVNMTDGQSHQVALYALDWDNNVNYDGSHRSERVDVVNASTGALIDSKVVSSFYGGQYLVWQLSGHVQFVVTLLSGPQAVVSGLFFGGGAAAPAPVAAPAIVEETPSPSSVQGSGTVLVSATFDQAINPSSASFVLTDLTNQVVPSTTRYDATRHTLTLVPSVPLMENDRYTASLSGVVGTSGVAASSASWYFDVNKDPHSTDPIKQAEHVALFKLVPRSDATAIALSSGSWGDPSIWSGGVVPGDGAKVDIPQGISVQVDGDFSAARVTWLYVEGSLRFNPDVNTGLKVVTTLVGENGYFEIGTATHRVAANVTAKFIIGNRGPRDAAMRITDPLDYTGGFISHGKTSLYGALTTSSATPQAIPRAGDTSITLSSVPNNWVVGDTLLFAGLSLTQNQDETRTIVSVSPDGLSYTFNSPLAYDHGGIYGYSQAAPVGNLTRNVTFSSEDSADLVDRGHVMFMHTQNEVIDSVAFDGLGRTDAQTQETFPKLDANGVLVPGTDANTAGRYAVHFHIRVGATYSQTPAVVTNSVILTSPKIGIDNHGGYALITNNVTYQVNGAGIFTENGSEIGTISGNMTVRSNGSKDNLDGRHGLNGDPNDYGFSGTGIWVQGGGVSVSNNFSSGQSSAAFIFFSNKLIDDTPSPDGFSVFLSQNLPDPSVAHGAPWVQVDTVPLTFSNNVGIASLAGLNVWSFNLFEVPTGIPTVIANSTFVNNANALLIAYSRHVTLTNDQLIGGNPYAYGQIYQDGVLGNEETSYISMTNVTIDGYINSWWMPEHGENSIQGGFIGGLLHVPPAYGGSLTINGVTWGSYPDQPTAHIELENSFTRPLGLKNMSGTLQPMVFTYNGQPVYYDNQAADYVPFSGISPDLDGKTNAQLWAQYGMAIGGRVAPVNLVSDPNIVGGGIGANMPFDPVLQTSDLLYGHIYDWAVPQIEIANPIGYSGTITVGGVQYTSSPKNLHLGWNVISVATASGTVSFMVFSDYGS